MSRPDRDDDGRRSSAQGPGGRGDRARFSDDDGGDDGEHLVVALSAVAGAVVAAGLGAVGVAAVALGGSLDGLLRAWAFLALVAGAAAFVAVRFRLYRRVGVFPGEARRVAAFGGLVAVGGVVGVGLLDWWVLAGGGHAGVVAFVLLAAALLGASALARRGDPVARCRVTVWTVGVGVALWSLGSGAAVGSGWVVPSATPLAPVIGWWLAGGE